MGKLNELRSDDIDETALSMSRDKGRSIVISVAYRLASFCDLIFGRELMLRFFLNGSWLFWRLGFERSGVLYGDPFHSQTKALSENTLKRWLSKDCTVIDIGCGVGRWCEIAAKYAKNVVGIDYSATNIEIARAKASKTSNIEYIVGDVTKDLGGRKFDVAVMTHVLEHIDDIDEILQELRKLVKIIIVEVPDFESDPLNVVRLEQGCRFYSDGDHVREYTQLILNDQLERNCWNILENFKSGGSVLAVAERRI